MKSAIVVGTGAGGATVAKELQGTFDVTILEAGREFRPFTMDLQPVRRFKAMGMMFDERVVFFHGLGETLNAHPRRDPVQ